VLIRQAVAEDVDRLADLRWAFRAEDGEEPAVSEDGFRVAYRMFFSESRERGRVHFVAEIDEAIVSTLVIQKVAMVPRPKRIRDEWGYVTDNYTLPELRGRGIGKAVLAYAIAWAREQDLELLIVWPSDDAVRHYERAGFRPDNDVMELVLREY
jgi:GNAT superfamily N-acetyltransferase